MTARNPLRLWPGVVAALVVLVVRYVVPLVVADGAGLGVIGGMAGGFAAIVWWLFLSRAPWLERIGAIVLMAVALLATSRIVHQSIANGMMGMLLPIYAIPVLSLALVAWAVATRHLSDSLRHVSLVIVILAASSAFTLVRTGGIVGGASSEWHWRWTPTPEERLLSQPIDEPLPPPARPAITEPPVGVGGPAPISTTSRAVPDAGAGREAVAVPSPATASDAGDWPGFRGPGRDGVVHGVRIATDWSQSPPVQLWHRAIGPGWSSFAVHGDLLYTQEQRGDDEIVASYKLATGESVWRHRDAVRFWESNGGAGPRATPTVSDGRVYAFGATGILNALDATTGSVRWSRDVAADTHTEVPMWGFASSPLAVDDVVIIAAAGTLAAYEAATGRLRWSGPAHGTGYSSPHRTTIDGVMQVMLLSGTGATSISPSNGVVLWEYAWPGSAIVQPAVTPDGGVLINSVGATGGAGIRRLAVTNAQEGWKVQERWTSTGLKPYFNDFVVDKGHAYGFDGSILSCIGLEDGERRWKGGRYGNGQLVLIADQDLLLVLTEEGEVALVEANPDQFRELARFRALEGKTWNHPVIVGDRLLLRNGEQMAAFRLSLVH